MADINYKGSIWIPLSSIGFPYFVVLLSRPFPGASFVTLAVLCLTLFAFDVLFVDGEIFHLTIMLIFECSFLSELHCSAKQDGGASGDLANLELLTTIFAQSDDILMVHLHLAGLLGLSSLNPFSFHAARRQLLQNSQYQSCHELEDNDAAENIFGDH